MPIRRVDAGTEIAATVAVEEMKAKSLISLCVVFVLLGMFACPFIEAATTHKQEMPCHGQQPAPRNSHGMLCCGDEAIPVQDSHAPVTSMELFILYPVPLAATLEICLASSDFDLLYRGTGEHLATLSILRL